MVLGLEFHLIQYSVTGVMVYSAYQDGKDKFHISTLVGGSEVRIRTEKEQFY